MQLNLLRLSMHLYQQVIKLYPVPFRQEFGREMEFVFGQQLKEHWQKNGPIGLLQLWMTTSVDTVTCSIIQHLHTEKGTQTMKKKNSSLLSSNQVFGWLAAITGFILSIPLVAMQFSNDVQWDFSDFLIMGCLLFGTGSLFVLLARHVQLRKHQIMIGIGLLVLLLWLWAELAVGIFTNWGS